MFPNEINRKGYFDRDGKTQQKAGDDGTEEGTETAAGVSSRGQRGWGLGPVQRLALGAATHTRRTKKQSGLTERGESRADCVIN